MFPESPSVVMGMPSLGSRTLSCTPWRQSLSIVSYGNTALASPSAVVYVAPLTHGNLATKVGAIVAGQTSVKAPEKAAFEAHLPQDVSIVSLHSLHGPTVSPVGHPLVRPWLLPCPYFTRPIYHLLGHHQAPCPR